MAIQIITDTSCDLPDSLLKQHEIELIPLKVSFDNGETFLDRVELSPAAFVKKMIVAKTLPKTSTPDPQTFIEYFKNGIKQKGHVLFVSLSSGLSSTFQTAQLACNILADQRVRIFDTLTGSLGSGIFAVKASLMANEGLPIDSIMGNLTAIQKKTITIFTLDTLDNVVKGGRLSRMEGFAGTLLNIKPILKGDKVTGTPYVLEKVRSRRKAMERMVTIIGEDAGSEIKQRLIGISHVDCENDAQRLAQMINEQYQPINPVIIAPMSATIGTYAGVGGLMINL